MVRLQLEMVVRPGWRQRLLETQRAGHAQMKEQPTRIRPRIQGQPQVLSSPPQRSDHPASQALRRDPQRPAQRLAQSSGAHSGALDAVRQAQAGDFDFR
jgi:hypothetical protein